MNGIISRLRKLELSAGSVQRLAVVVLANGERRRMPAADAIPLFCDPRNSVIDITGGGSGDGVMVQLLAGLIEKE